MSLSHHTAADVSPWLQLSHRSNTFSLLLFLMLSGSWWGQPQTRSHRRFQELSTSGRYNHSSPTGVGQPLRRERCSAGAVSAPSASTETWSRGFSGGARAVRRARREMAGPRLHSMTPLVKSRAGGRLRKVGTRGDTVAAYSLPCWGQPSRSGNATLGAVRCWHVPPHGNHVTARIPNSKQPLNTPFSGFLPKATQFPFFQGLKADVASLSRVLLHDFCWQNISIAVTVHFRGKLCD